MITEHSITQEDIARGIARGRRLRGVAIRAAFAALFVSTKRRIVTLRTVRRDTPPAGAHNVAV